MELFQAINYLLSASGLNRSSLVDVVTSEGEAKQAYIAYTKYESENLVFVVYSQGSSLCNVYSDAPYISGIIYANGKHEYVFGVPPLGLTHEHTLLIEELYKLYELYARSA